jgi:hypothetical protein
MKLYLATLTVKKGVTSMRKLPLALCIIAVSITLASLGCDDTTTALRPSFMVTDSGITIAESVYAKPGYLTKMIQGEFTVGTSKDTVQRIVGNPGSAIGTGFTGNWPKDARHHYAKDQPWNWDGTLLKLDTPSGLILDGTTYAPKYQCTTAGLWDYRWDRIAPVVNHDVVNVTQDSLKLTVVDVRTCTHDASWPDIVLGSATCKAAGFGSGEGNLSDNGKFVAWLGIGSGCNHWLWDVARTMDPRTGYSGPYLSTTRLTDTVSAVDWVSFSPSGKFIVVHYQSSATQVYAVDTAQLLSNPCGSPWPPCQLNPSFAVPRPVHESQSWPGQIGDTSQGYIYSVGHADLIQNPFDGSYDYICGQEHASPSNHGHTITSSSGTVVAAVGYLICVRLKDNKVITLSTPFPGGVTEAYIDHVSARSNQYTSMGARTGWVYVSTFNDVAGRAYYDEIDAYALDGVSHMERIAHLHSNYTNPPTCVGNTCYRSEPQPVPSPDGKRVLFASNWMTACGTGCGGSRDTTQAFVVGPYR